MPARCIILSVVTGHPPAIGVDISTLAPHETDQCNTEVVGEFNTEAGGGRL